ncbi:aspartate aminotransferase family protein [Kribbella solani]|uniref:aspartate aminotransferase family protein n=1 Tax=Kribbella solani TaxID=236067 RepID=UPI0029B187FB|nr:aspartate aminotransferase family protein [Kribbella solani]MDX2968126.1 aspartate aminotransferase family protein [Kribbella solani]MDX3004861.1 aspartate aminotransferase family protein [Kribbella solani]
MTSTAQTSPDYSSWPVRSVRSRELYDRARSVVPGGVVGQGRIYDPYPLYIDRADGAHVWDVDGNRYLDFHSAFGAVLLGHNHERIRTAMETCLRERGVTFAAAHPLEAELAERIVEMVPCAEMAVFSCTGSEATLHALRLARAVTGRQKVLKFEGNYHGWNEHLNWSVHFDAENEGGPAERPVPYAESAGVAQSARENVLVVQYNDTESLTRIVEEHRDELAAVIVEPMFFNAGVVLAEPGFLEQCRALCDAVGAILIFDEVITGFRVSPGGAQQALGVVPDLVTMGKAVANGMPISVLAGRRDLLENLSPTGPTFFSGTFYGHTLSVAAAVACTQFLSETPELYDQLDALGRRLRDGLREAAAEGDAQVSVESYGSVWSMHFGASSPRTYRDISKTAKTKNAGVQRDYQRWMLERGVYIHPHYMIRGYLTAAHNADHIDHVIESSRSFFAAHRSDLS